MKNVIKHQAHPWGREVWFTQDQKALEALGRKFDLNTNTEGSLGLCWGTSGPLIIWIRPGAGHGVMAHECCHAALDILDYAGMNPAHSNGEPMCYTLQRMIEAFTPHLLPPQNS
ncbi:hypothetical protein AWB76_07203 [Caballeronia temeraria]|uniref:Uncharacterized protein n=1 Tax=Caballeronia temeraria TaxID=1777137 RepID=A0A158DMI1_9BURK|nr:hypothetical protein [Caballeronia temeraria]SAK95822.1 hypothetical protein AWB76_07203 [Caballeronia temeraria]